jgi:hypothetical protein
MRFRVLTGSAARAALQITALALAASSLAVACDDDTNSDNAAQVDDAGDAGADDAEADNPDDPRSDNDANDEPVEEEASSGLQEEVPSGNRENDGELCIGNHEPATQRCGLYELADGEPLLIAVELGCEPCGATIDAIGCEASVDGTEITVESWLRITPSSQDVSCADMCQPLAAECETPPLPAGDYTLTHGEYSLQFTVGAQNLKACTDVHDQEPCCVEAGDCPTGWSCDDNRCRPISCSDGFDCPEGTACRNGSCGACECESGQACDPRSGECVPDQARGPAYQTCKQDSDCEGLFEVCLRELGVCTAPCRDEADCGEAFPSGDAGGAPVVCVDYAGVTDGSSCVLDCTEDGGDCPEGMSCVNGLFCSDEPADGTPSEPAPSDGPCEREDDTASASCDNDVGNYYSCSCEFGSNDSAGGLGGLYLASSCEEALDLAWCGE